MRKFLGRHVVIYRPHYVDGLHCYRGGSWYPLYALRAKIFGIRVPVLWAFELSLLARGGPLSGAA